MSGSLREKSPGVWDIRVALGRDPLTGRYRSVSRTVHGGKRKAEEEIARIVSSAASGKFQGTRANVRYLTEQWLEHLERLARSPKTLEGYRSLIKNGIDPALGSIELAKLSASDIDRFYGLRRRRDRPITRSTTATPAYRRPCTGRSVGDGSTHVLWPFRAREFVSESRLHSFSDWRLNAW